MILQALMGAVLAVAVKDCQIVIFTGVPERYAFVWWADVVPLEQNRRRVHDLKEDSSI